MSNTARLLAAIQAGDREAFASLVESQGRRLFGVAYKITGDGAEAEDAVQEAFLRIFKGRAPRREPGAADAWLGRIVGRIAFDTVRKRRTRLRADTRAAKGKEGQMETPRDPGAKVWGYEDPSRANARELLYRWRFVTLVGEALHDPKEFGSTVADDKGQFALIAPKGKAIVLRAKKGNGASRAAGL